MGIGGRGGEVWLEGVGMDGLKWDEMGWNMKNGRKS